jgi:hypothetical protein
VTHFQGSWQQARSLFNRPTNGARNGGAAAATVIEKKLNGQGLHGDRVHRAAETGGLR